jgi:hypothetical protein
VTGSSFVRPPSSSRSASKRRRANSLHKLDTLITALQVFRKGLIEGFAEYGRPDKELKELIGE